MSSIFDVIDKMEADGSLSKITPKPEPKFEEFGSTPDAVKPVVGTFKHKPEPEPTHELQVDEAWKPEPTTQPKPPEPEIILNTEQRAAIESFKTNKHGLLIGYAGTGKTTAVNRLLYELTHDVSGELKADIQMKDEQRHECGHLNLPPKALNVAICAFTGMAVKQLKSKLFEKFGDYPMHLHCYTIHKLIDYAPEDEEYFDHESNEYKSKRIFRPQKNKYNKLPFDIVIIDEISMVGEHLMKQLLDALPLEKTRIYGIGDIAQIPPIFSDSTMLPMLKKWPITELTTIYRQKDGSIIDNANRIREGMKPIFNDACRALKIDDDRRKAQAQVVNYMKKEFESGNYDPEQDIILCTNNQLQLGQELMNIQIRHIVNPNHDKIINVKTMRQTKQYAVGDRVMVTKNDAELGIYNGMIGVIEEIQANPSYEMGYRQSEDLMQIDFGDIDAVMADKEKEQIDARKEIEMMKQMGTYNPDEAKDNEEENNGTGKREASHNVVVSFPDENDRRVSFHTSSLIENLIPAWVITTHKSQGSGFRSVFLVLHQSGGQLLFNELFYTGFTRCQEGITLFTNEFALNKAINQRRINGNTLDEKLTWFMDKYKNFDMEYLPDNKGI